MTCGYRRVLICFRRATWFLSSALVLVVTVVGVVCLAQAPTGASFDEPSLTPAQQDSKWGYVDREGRFRISPQFDFADRFSEGLAAVKVGNRFGYIDLGGHFVVQPRYFRAGPFKDGFAWVVTRKPFAPLGSGEYGFAINGRVTYIDRSGREIRPSISAEYVSNFSEGMAAVRTGEIVGGCSGKVGYLNTKGDWAIKPQFDEARDFSDGLAAVNQGGKCHIGGKWGYIDKDGTLVIPFRYDFVRPFKDGHACVEEGGQWKLIDVKGNGVTVEENNCPDSR
jgi:hypothetical protein